MKFERNNNSITLTHSSIHIIVLLYSWILAVAMSSVVKLFNTLQRFYKTLGFDIYSTRSCHSKCLASAKIQFFLFSSAQLLISTMAFFLFQARIAIEYGISFYISITILVTIFNTTTIACNIAKFVALIRNYEEFIDKS